eukprot:TRINITY_DN10755_c0_g1_i1.p1 TRINITY_DN10755_c0_g1~~TRINITY_DN10755_c0_g1_i1.p1  ORF type:complete len:417 (-),score=47.78 TRINITY_DN10755_c0_g1_i1:660-1910(-)
MATSTLTLSFLFGLALTFRPRRVFADHGLDGNGEIPELSQPPDIPSFSASAKDHDMIMVAAKGKHTPIYSNIGFKYDSKTGNTEWLLTSSNFGAIGPSFEHLQARQSCVGRQCMVSDRGGVLCYAGYQANIRILSELLNHFPERALKIGSAETCDTWQVRLPSVGNLSLCLTASGQPKSLTVEPYAVAVGPTNVGAYSFNMTFANVRIGNVKIEAISCPTRVPKPCPGNGTASFQVLRATNGGGTWGELEDRDTFDWKGLGVTLGVSGFHSRKYLEIFDVEAATSFGIWRDCGYNSKLKKNTCDPPLSPEFSRLVSRSSSEQLEGVYAGQCGENVLVGSWLTFPLAGKCGIDESVGDNGCTWKKRAAKVMAMECLFSFDSGAVGRAFKEDYQKAPFLHTIEVAKAAIKSCPDVRLV